MTTDILAANPGYHGGGLVDQPLGFRAQEERRPERWLERIYAMPRPMRSLEEYMRARHQDLPSLNELDVRLELDAVRRRLQFEHDELRVEWLSERLQALAKWLEQWGSAPALATARSTEPSANHLITRASKDPPLRTREAHLRTREVGRA